MIRFKSKITQGNDSWKVVKETFNSKLKMPHPSSEVLAKLNFAPQLRRRSLNFLLACVHGELSQNFHVFPIDVSTLDEHMIILLLLSAEALSLASKG